MVNEAAGVPPNATALTSSKLLPVMVTLVPPLVGPTLGPIEVTVGGSRYSKSDAESPTDSPAALMARMDTVPDSLADGVVRVSSVLEITVGITSTLPITTSEPAVKFVPVTVISVPPLVGPAFGLTPMTVGTP